MAEEAANGGGRRRRRWAIAGWAAAAALILLPFLAMFAMAATADDEDLILTRNPSLRWLIGPTGERRRDGVTPLWLAGGGTSVSAVARSRGSFAGDAEPGRFRHFPRPVPRL
jgi:hypothetical protein